MPDCTDCGTWNPDDKDVCWRCQTVLPRPVEKKPRRRIMFLGMPIWVWLVVALIFFMPLLFGQCGPVGIPTG